MVNFLILIFRSDVLSESFTKTNNSKQKSVCDASVNGVVIYSPVEVKWDSVAFVGKVAISLVYEVKLLRNFVTLGFLLTVSRWEEGVREYRLLDWVGNREIDAKYVPLYSTILDAYLRDHMRHSIYLHCIYIVARHLPEFRGF